MVDAPRSAALDRRARPRRRPRAARRRGASVRSRRQATPARLEDELFRFGRLVAGNPELRDALSDPARSDATTRRRWSTGLLEGKALPATRRAWPCRPSRRQPPHRSAGARELPEGRRRASQRAASPPCVSRAPLDRRRAARAARGRAAAPVRPRRSTSTSSSTPTSSAASGSRSATTSSTAPSPAASTRPAAQAGRLTRRPTPATTRAPTRPEQTERR